MKKLLILFTAFLFATTVFGQGVPGKDNLLWWQNLDSTGVTASLTLNGVTRDTVYFDFRSRSGTYKGPWATFTGSFNLWIYCDSLKGDPDIAIRYYPLTTNQAIGGANIRDWKKIYNERMAWEGFNFTDNLTYGPIKVYCEEAFGIAFIGQGGTSTDTATVELKIGIGGGLNMPVSPYRDGVRYFNEYTNSTLQIIGSTDTLNIDIPLGASEGYTGIQFTATVGGAVDSVNCTYTPYTAFGSLATNRTTTLFSTTALVTATTYDYSLTALPPCDKVRLTLWSTDCVNDTFTISNFYGALRYKMGSGK